MINESITLQARLSAKLAVAKLPAAPTAPAGDVSWFLTMPQPSEWNAAAAKAGSPLEMGLLMETSPRV